MKKALLFTMALMVACSAIFASTSISVIPASDPNLSHCTVCPSKLMLSKKEEMKMEVMKIYSCSGHSDQFSSKPGKCPKCNKKMVGSKCRDRKKN